MTKELTSPYGNSPDSLPAQPDAAAQTAQFLNQISQVRIPQVPGAPSLVPPNTPRNYAQPEDPDAALSRVDPNEVDFFAEDEVDFFGQTPGPLNSDRLTAPSEDKPTFSEMVGEHGVLEATGRYAADSLLRARLSFAQTDWETATALEETFGKENVRVQNGKVQYRRPGDEKFRNFDANKTELFDDALDLGRFATEIAAEGAIRGGLTAAGTMAGGPAGGALAAGSTGGLSAAGALTVGDFIAQGILRIPRDPARSSVKELGLAAAMGTMFGAAGKAFTQWRAAKAAREASGVNSEAVLKTAQELEQISDNLAQNGINLKNGKMTLSPGQQASRYVPEAEALDTHLGTEGPVRRFFEEQGRLFVQGWDDLRAGISNIVGKNTDDLFSKVKESSKLSTELEGKMIEGFRDQALAVSKGQPRALPQATQALEDFMFGPQGLGFRRVAGRDAITFAPTVTVKGPSFKELKAMFPDASGPALAEYDRMLRSFERRLRSGNGQMNLADVNKTYTQMRKFIDNNIGTSNDKVAKSLIGLKNELRDDWTLLIGQELGQYGPSKAHGHIFPDMKGMTVIRPNALDDYMKSLSKYSDMKKAQDTLGNILAKNDLSAAAFADQLFSPAQGKDRVRQAKILIQENTPELWDRLRGTFLDTLTEKHTKLAKGTGTELERTIDWQGLTKSLDKLDRAEILDQMFDGTSTFTKEHLKQFLTLAGRIDSSVRIDAKALEGAAAQGLLKRLAIVAMPGTSSTAKIANLSTLIGGMGKDKAVAKWLDGKGLELVLQGVPKAKQHEARVLFSRVLDQILRTGARQTVTGAAGESTPYEMQEISGP